MGGNGGLVELLNRKKEEVEHSCSWIDRLELNFLVVQLLYSSEQKKDTTHSINTQYKTEHRIINLAHLYYYLGQFHSLGNPSTFSLVQLLRLPFHSLVIVH